MSDSSTQHNSNKPAHSNFRKGLSDYNDGGNITHHLGNDDYKHRSNLPDPYEEKASFDGSEALGNDLLEDEESDDQEINEKENRDEQ